MYSHALVFYFFLFIISSSSSCVSGKLFGPTPDQHLSWSQTQKNMLPHVA